MASPEKPLDPVKTAARTLDVFEAFAAAKGPLTLTELAARLGSPISSCHALVRTLQARGYVYILDERKRVYPTKRLLTVALQIAENDPMLERIGPVLHDLQQATGETILLGKRQGTTVTYLEVVESRHTIRFASTPGDTKLLHCSAIGKAMLGAMSEPECAKLVRRLSLPASNANTITDRTALLQNIAQGRERGYYITRGENVADVMAISIARCIGAEWYGVAVAGPIGRLEADLPKLVADLMRAGDVLQQIDLELSGGL
jgi:DNA-binding IclR family transcriptional regulator